jgi:isoleucyl-tRNA synthetase
VPMPFFVHKETGEPHPKTAELLEQACLLVEKSGVEAWFSLDSDDFLNKYAPENMVDYKKVTYTLDVWFDSGATHAAVLKRRPELTHLTTQNAENLADLYLEGSDQHRGWFQSSLLTGCAIDGKAPYKALLTHGFVVDGAGHKMSKSKGNVVAPQKVMDTYGADILRLWVASTDYSGELTISDEILKRVAESYRRIRNTMKFLLANLADFDKSTESVPVAELLEIDRYAYGMLHDLSEQCRTAYDNYEFHRVAQTILNYCSETLGGFYLDILKDRLYTTPEDSRARRSAQTVLLRIAEVLSGVMAPIMSFTADEVWQILHPNSENILLHNWTNEVDPIYASELKEFYGDLHQKWSQIRGIRRLAMKEIEVLRANGLVGSSLQAELDIYASKEYYDSLSALGDELKFVMISSRATLHLVETDEEQKVVVTTSKFSKCDRCWHYRADVGSHAEHPTICGRCVSNLFGAGEVRKYA